MPQANTWNNGPTVLHGKRVDFYHCVVFAVFSGETYMYLHLLDIQLGQWMDYLHMQWQADVTFYVVSAYVNVRKLPIFMLGRDSGDWIIVKNPDLS